MAHSGVTTLTLTNCAGDTYTRTMNDAEIMGRLLGSANGEAATLALSTQDDSGATVTVTLKHDETKQAEWSKS